MLAEAFFSTMEPKHAEVHASIMQQEPDVFDDRNSGYVVASRSWLAIIRDAPCTQPFVLPGDATFGSSTGAFIDVNDLGAQSAFQGIEPELLRLRNSQNQERFIFGSVKPLIETHGIALLQRVERIIERGEVPELGRRYFAYMLSYIEDPRMQDYCFKALVRFSASVDPWLRLGAQEGLSHRFSA